MRAQIFHGDCLEGLLTIKTNSIDSLVTDPPAGISFMGKDWDGDKGGRKEWIAWMEEVMRECLRVMKPGAHGLVWALPRTSHWTAMALEDAGFEVRDCVYHLFGSGFPKSLDISKAIDKAAGAEREKLGKNPHLRPNSDGKQCGYSGVQSRSEFVTAPSTDAAKQWQGFGTALKPAVECWWLIRKPLSEKTVAANVLKHGTGGLNIDGSRIEASQDYGRSAANSKGTVNAHDGFEGKSFKIKERDAEYASPLGRFPSHLVLSHSEHCTEDQCDIECAIKLLDEQSGHLHGHGSKAKIGKGIWGNTNATQPIVQAGGDSGGASRFFYCAKTSSSERNAGLEGMESKVASVGNRESAGRDGANPNNYHQDSIKRRIEAGLPATEPKANRHPTVKPQKLMRYLIKLVTPPGGTVLDPFMGSGSTGVAAVSEGFQFVGIEQNSEYAQIAEKRIRHSL